MIVLFALAIFLVCPPYAALYAAAGMWISAASAVFCAVSLGVAPWLFRRTRSVPFGAHWVTGVSYLTLLGVSLPTGGIAAPAAAWQALIPVAATMLGGVRIGLVWTGIALATVLLYGIVDLSGWTPPIETPPEWRDALRIAVTSGLVGIIALLAWLYETNKDRMLAALQAANDELGVARDAARAAHRGAREVLDHVDQALLTVTADGVVADERSRAAEVLFGARPSGTRVWELFGSAPGFAEMLELGWEALFDGVLPVELALGQLPSRCGFDDRRFSLRYIPSFEEERLVRVLVVVSDVTAEVAAVEAERDRREQLEVFRWVIRDRAFFSAFRQEAEELVAKLTGDAGTFADQRRHLHTLKGNAALFGLGQLSEGCHRIEQEIADTGQTALTGAQRAELAHRWAAARAMSEPLLGKTDADVVVVDRREHERLLDAARSTADRATLIEAIERWTWEPASVYLGRLAEQARVLAERLERAPLRVTVDADGVLLPPGRWQPFWSAAAHVVRNAVDHGIEPPDERTERGKDRSGELSMRVRFDADELAVTFADDGRGIDWLAVARKANGLGLPTGGADDLVRALFADGLSTREDASLVSGRGIGMGAAWAACEALGGEARVESEPGRGTTIRFLFPRKEAPRQAGNSV